MADAGPADEELPVRTKLGWGTGGICEAMMAGAFPTLVGPIYNIALGLDAATLGLIGSLPRFVDAAYDIWLGNLSDNARMKWGRRRPFIAIGAVCCFFFFAALWWVPTHWHAHQQLWYFGILSAGYWLSFSTFAIPFNALGFELTLNYDERTSVQAYRFFAVQLSSLATAGLYPLCFSRWFAGVAHTGMPPELTGVRWVTLLFGVIVLLSGLAPALLTRENPIGEMQPYVPLADAIRITFTDRLFLHFIAMIIISISGVSICTSLGLYVMIYHVFGGSRQPAANLTFIGTLAATGTTLAFTLVLPAVSKRIGKKGTIILGQILIAVGGILSWWLYSRAHPYWTIGAVCIGSAGMACFQILYGSFLGDICDVDELRFGARREGLYGAAATFMNKIVYASQGAINGFVLAWTGYSAQLSAQTPSTVLRLRFVYAALPAIFAVIGFLLAISFPINARRAAEVKQQLDQRHAAKLNAPLTATTSSFAHPHR